MQIDIIAGTRPNLVKVAPLISAIERFTSDCKYDENVLSYRFIYTGQHYDKNLSTNFFRDLNIPEPHLNLDVGSGSHSVQTANIMVGYESAIMNSKPDLCIVVGDVNSTLACALAAKKCNVEVAHIEAGIRSGDRTMPEETNRIATDSISDWFYTTGETANNNLLNSGCSTEQIITVGNIMIDSLVNKISEFRKPNFWDTHQLDNTNYLLLTLHRPENVDNPDTLRKLLSAVDQHAYGRKVLFPVHPRTKAILNSLDLNLENIELFEPLRYLEFMYLVSHCCSVITDSGGLSEETTFLKKPCITLRSSTERPETIEIGTNVLVGKNIDELANYLRKACHSQWKQGKIPPLWDGKTAQRIVDHLVSRCLQEKQNYMSA